MFTSSRALIVEKSRISREFDDFVPRLYDVRRVAVRYQRMLPLSVMKEHQCVVLGATPHILTIGIVELKDKRWFYFIQALTGTAIFPVLIEPARMRLLLARIERYQRFRQRYSRAFYVLHLPLQVRQFLLLHECERERA